MMSCANVRPVALAALLLVATGCQEATAPTDGAGYPLLPAAEAALSPEQRRTYEEDAVRLAVRHLVATRSPLRHAVEPPSALVTSLYNAFVAVHAFDHPARDSVVELLKVRAFPNPPVYEMMVAVNPAADWTQAWRDREALTGNPAIDDLVTRYGISVQQFYLWPTDQVAVLHTNTPVNTTALATRFAAIGGVVWAEANGFMGDGNDIRAKVEGGGWRLDYSVGYGDCPAGCTGRTTWTFAVDAGGGVRYVGRQQSGSPPFSFWGD